MKTPSSILALASLVASVHGHGYISKPKASYEPNTIYTNYNALTTASVNSGFAGGKYDGSPSQNTQVFNDHWNATGYKSLRDMMDPLAPGYGHSLETADPVDVAGYTEMWWQNDEYKEGFIASHEGPCEAWIDDVQIFHHDNCAAQFKTYPAKVPADYSSCKGDCLFVFYWLALHEPNWQIYKQCVPITNSGSGTSTTTQSSGSEDTNTSSDNGASGVGQTTTNAPVVTTVTPVTAPVATKVPVTSTTLAPEVTPATPEGPTGAPIATTATPVATPFTPEATKAAATTEAPTAQDNCHV